MFSSDIIGKDNVSVLAKLVKLLGSHHYKCPASRDILQRSADQSRRPRYSHAERGSIVVHALRQELGDVGDAVLCFEFILQLRRPNIHLLNILES